MSERQPTTNTPTNTTHIYPKKSFREIPFAIKRICLHIYNNPHRNLKGTNIKKTNRKAIIILPL